MEWCQNDKNVRLKTRISDELKNKVNIIKKRFNESGHCSGMNIRIQKHAQS